MRRAATIALAAALLAGAPAQAPAASAEIMVVGKERVLQAPREMRLKKRTVKVAGRRCAVGARTPLSVLAGTRLPLRIKAYGKCTRSPADAAGLYVRRIARDAARGSDGWVYKVGRRAGTGGAGDTAGPFGAGGLRDGAQVLWFYCRKARRQSCQRTLEVRAAAREVAPGAPVEVTVRGYDDSGRGVAVEGATVALGEATAVTGAGGTATVSAPAQPGSAELVATRDGMVRSFPAEVTVR